MHSTLLSRDLRGGAVTIREPGEKFLCAEIIVGRKGRVKKRARGPASGGKVFRDTPGENESATPPAEGREEKRRRAKGPSHLNHLLSKHRLREPLQRKGRPSLGKPECEKGSVRTPPNQPGKAGGNLGTDNGSPAVTAISSVHQRIPGSSQVRGSKQSQSSAQN